MFDKRRFKAALALAGVSATELASAIGINASTLYRKINADGDFTREEISKITSFLGIGAPQVQAIFFANELAETQDGGE